MERSWLRGCPCHEEECKRSAHTGVPFECPNNAKGQKGPLWRERVGQASKRFRVNQNLHRYSAEDGPDGTISLNISLGISGGHLAYHSAYHSGYRLGT